MLALDTSTVSYFFRGDPAVAPRLKALPPSQVALHNTVLYELRYGLMRPPAGLWRAHYCSKRNAVVRTRWSMPCPSPLKRCRETCAPKA